jgi:hypothetical protein
MVSGLGIHLVREIMDELQYQRVGDTDLLILKQKFGRPEPWKSPRNESGCFDPPRYPKIGCINIEGVGGQTSQSRRRKPGKACRRPPLALLYQPRRAARFFS